MTVTSIIKRIRDAGGEITLANDDIKLRVPAFLRDEAIVQIKAQRDEIKSALKHEAVDPWVAEDYLAFFNERAGIAEHDAGLAWASAERKAYEETAVSRKWWKFEDGVISG